MLTNDQTFEVKLTPQSINTIEEFVDTICDQLFINETYYGNILMSLTEIFGLINDTTKSDTIKITYNTDYQKVRISLQPIDAQLITSLKKNLSVDDITDNLVERSLFLVMSLVDEIESPDDFSISLTFDISAMHNKVYQHRQSLLHSYFTETKKDKVHKDND